MNRASPTRFSLDAGGGWGGLEDAAIGSTMPDCRGQAARQAEPLLLNPKFDLSRALGGADGDLIAADTLWDFKSSAHGPSVFGRDDLWQLIGYAFADQSDTYKIASVGIAAIRRRQRVCYSLTELLAELSNERRALKQWRAGFAETVRAANARRCLARSIMHQRAGDSAS